MPLYSNGSVLALATALALVLSSTSSTSAFTTLPTPVGRVVVPTVVRSASTTTATLVETTAIESTESPPPLAPLTVWGEPYDDIVRVQQQAKLQPLPEFGVELSALSVGLSSQDTNAQLQYFREHRKSILEMMQNHGCLVLRDFDLMKTQKGFSQFYEAIGMKACLDPLHSVSARPTINGDKNSPVYEAVNKESRKNFFIGMHNEFVGTRAPRAAAFCCFKPAETGGEFLIADGRRIFRDLPTDLLEALYQKQIRYSVMELPFFGFIDTVVPEFLQAPVAGLIQGLVKTAINMKVDFDVDLQWGISDYDNVRMLQARAPRQPPIVAHPVTGDPTWFCNVHSHSSQLRHNRESKYGAERFEDGASRINKSDMFFGDDSPLTTEQLQQLDEITMRNVRFVKMREGDVVLLDNYKTLHGRNVFDGTRKHAVCWFEGWEGEEEMKQAARQKMNMATA